MVGESQPGKDDMALDVKGMRCGHCAAAVARAVKEAAPEAGVAVDLASGRVALTGQANATRVAEAIRTAGFEVAPAE